MYLYEVINSQEVLKRWMGVSMPAKVAWRIKRVVDLVQPELVRYGEMKDELIKKYGVQHEDHISVEPGTLGYQKFVEEMDSFTGEDLDFDFVKIKVDDITFPTTPGEIGLVAWMIEE